MKSQPNEKEAERAVIALIETYRQGFLHLDPEQIASIWDTQHEPPIYVAQEMKEPTYGWPAIQRYMAALPEHLGKASSKEVKDARIDILGDAALAFVTSHSSVKLRARPVLHEPIFRVSMAFHRTGAGRRAIHFHESSLSAQAAGDSGGMSCNARRAGASGLTCPAMVVRREPRRVADHALMG